MYLISPAIGLFVQMFMQYTASMIHGANMGPTWVLPVPGGPHVGHMKLAIWVVIIQHNNV